MQKIFLHIGTHKTATTWLQHYFARNSDRLNDFGIYYPTTGRVTQAQHRLGQAVFQRSRPDHPLDALPVWAKFKRELELTRYENILISSEEFEWIQYPDTIRKFLPEVEIHVIVYLRRQDDYLESLYGQQIRDFNPREFKTIHQYMDGNRLNFLDYAALLKRWERASDSMTVRIFDKSQLVGGDIGLDFLSVLGIKSADGFEAPTAPIIDHKASLGMEALEFLRKCNSLKLTAALHDQLVTQVIRLDKSKSAILPNKRQRLLGREARNQLMSRFASGNAELTRRYFPNLSRRSIFADVTDDTPVYVQSNDFNPFDVLLQLNSLVRVP